MESEETQLVRPTAALKNEFFSLLEDFQAVHETRIHDQTIAFIQANFAAYLQQLQNSSQGIGLKPGFVPATTFWLIKSGRVVGESRLRHWLTPALKDCGGHIGYMVRPTDRGQGCGTQLLQMTLVKAQEIGLNRVLVTCDADNLASARVIQKNKGRLANRGISKQTGKTILRYWIAL